MDLGIAGRRAVVAASTSGLGLATAQALGAAGCEVVINGRDESRLAQAAATVANCHPIRGDVSTVAGAQAFMATARAELGGVDILVTNAGGPPPGTFATTPLNAYGPATELNLLAMVAMCHEAVPSMREQGWGRVVAITSIAVRQPIDTLILSNTARAGYTGFLKTLALEVAADGVTVNSIQPGLHRTPRVDQLYGDKAGEAAATVPMQVMGDPDDFGAVVAFLCSQQASFITGVALPVDGGHYRGLQ